MLVGALGEVGRSLRSALTDHGNEVVPVSSRADAADSTVLSVDAAVRFVASSAPDLVVHAGGRGDKRTGERDALHTSRLIGQACEQGGIRGVLISTIRVLEDSSTPIPGSAVPECHSDYARANAANEQAWLEAAPSQGFVVRLANYFCAPSSSDSPQTQLLPWSLVTEALDFGRINVRSAPTVVREFVSAQDAATAIRTIASASDPARFSSTTPGHSVDLRQLTNLVGDAFEVTGRMRPAVTFGEGPSSGPTLQSDWLAAHGWCCTLADEEVANVIAGWLSEHHSKKQ